MVTFRVLIVSTERDRGSLAAVRALHRAGWYVGVGTPDGQGMLSSAKGCAQRHVVPRPRGDGSAFVTGVQQALADGRYDIVFGAGDDWMAALSYYREFFPVPIPHPSIDAVYSGLDKFTLSHTARRVGLDAPHTEPVTSDTIAEWQGPVIVKSRTHWNVSQTRPYRIEAQRFAGIDTARAQIDRLHEAGTQAVLQEPITGQLSALIGLYHNGRLDGRVQQVTSGLWPVPNGVSTRARTVPVDAELASRAEKLLAQIGWQGLVELQFLRDEQGTAHLIDLNGRFYGSMALAESARPGLVHTWALRALGEPTSPLSDGKVGVRYAWSAADLRRAMVERRGGLARDLIDTLRWATRAKHSVWALRDLAPTRRLVTERYQHKALRPESGDGPDSAPS